jgi:hypothetical protein
MSFRMPIETPQIEDGIAWEKTWTFEGIELYI